MASADGTTIDRALSALFELCVPAVSGGHFKQTFPADLIVPLTDAERKRHSIDSSDAWRIAADEDFILFEIRKGSAQVVTGDGKPREARERFLRRLVAEGGRVKFVEGDAEDPMNIAAEIPLDAGRDIVIAFSVGLEEGRAGFYGSAFLVERA